MVVASSQRQLNLCRARLRSSHSRKGTDLLERVSGRVSRIENASVDSRIRNPRVGAVCASKNASVRAGAAAAGLTDLPGRGAARLRPEGRLRGQGRAAVGRRRGPRGNFFARGLERAGSFTRRRRSLASPDAAQVKEDLPGKDGAPGEVQAFRDYCWPDLPVFLDEKRAFYGALGGGKESKGSIASFFANLLNPFSQLYKNTKRVPKTTEGNFVGEGFIKGGARRRRGSVEGGWSAADASRRRRGDCSADASRHYRGDRHRGGVAAAPPGLFAEASRRRRGDRPRIVRRAGVRRQERRGGRRSGRVRARGGGDRRPPADGRPARRARLGGFSRDT